MSVQKINTMLLQCSLWGIVFCSGILLSQCSQAQNTITGSVVQLAGQTVTLTDYNGLQTYTIDSGVCNPQGAFKLRYTEKDYGMAYLNSGSNQSLQVVLEPGNIILKGESLSVPASITLLEGKQNQLFAAYSASHPSREQALSAWVYLEKIYTTDMLFAAHQEPRKAILNEMQRLRTEDSLFLANLSPEWYIAWYLPLRKLVSSVPVIAQYRTHEIPAALSAFRNLDYIHPHLYKSGLLRDVLESHFWLLENSGRSLDSVYIEMQVSIDYLLTSLLKDEQKLNEISGHLFKYLESRSLFTASEYLAIKLLNEQGCTLNSNLTAQLESYRAMKKGNIAPDIAFTTGDLLYEKKWSSAQQNLSALPENYTLVIFGASWCQKCREEVAQLSGLYQEWKNYGVEVVFISLDERKPDFMEFVSPLPFVSYCDYRKWESPVVKDYHVFATPTFYLLNKNRKILLRPNSVSHMDSWVDWYLIKGNKQPIEN